jgi:hypothetical protein
MSKETHDFCAVANYEELEAEDAAIRQRRIETYSVQALQVGLKVDQITILHTAFKDGLAALDRVFQIAPQVRMPHGIRLVGPTGSGKTALARYFEESLPRSTLFEQGFGCLRVRISTTPSAGHVVASLLRRCCYPFTRGSERRAHWQQDLAFDLVRAKGTRLIIFEQAHRLIDAQRGGRYSRDSNPGTAAAVICDLIDEVPVGVVLTGQDSLARLADTEPELESRISSGYALSDYAADTQWSGIVRGFVKQCTWFDLGGIATDAQVKLLHLACRGNLRALKRLLTETVLVAAQAGARAADGEHLREAFARVNGKSTTATNPYA